MTKERIIDIFEKLGAEMSDQKWQGRVANKAFLNNPWFTPSMVLFQLNHFITEFFEKEKINSWLTPYDLNIPSAKSVGLILAGNIPAVGWHDIMCGLVSGHLMQIKMSSKDDVIIPEMINLLFQIEPKLKEQISLVDRLKNHDAVIATGASSSQDYFQKYFGNKPFVARGHRNALAVIHGDESREDISQLADDVFMYFGLGCRNVSKIWFPEDYDVKPMLMQWEDKYSDMVQHNKYMNNYDYNKTMLLMNKVSHLSSAILHLIEDSSLHSRISNLHYQTYKSLDEVTKQVNNQRANIQCVVSTKPIPGMKAIRPGTSQKPSLNHYADHIDTLQFLSLLS